MLVIGIYFICIILNITLMRLLDKDMTSEETVISTFVAPISLVVWLAIGLSELLYNFIINKCEKWLP